MKLPDKNAVPNDAWDIIALQDAWKSLKNVTAENFDLEGFQQLAKRTFELLYSLHRESVENSTDTIPKSVAALLIDINAFSTLVISSNEIIIAQKVAGELVEQTLCGWKTPAEKAERNIVYYDEAERFSVSFDGNVYNISTSDFDLSPIIDG